MQVQINIKLNTKTSWCRQCKHKKEYAASSLGLVTKSVMLLNSTAILLQNIYRTCFDIIIPCEQASVSPMKRVGSGESCKVVDSKTLHAGSAQTLSHERVQVPALHWLPKCHQYCRLTLHVLKLSVNILHSLKQISFEHSVLTRDNYPIHHSISSGKAL